MIPQVIETTELSEGRRLVLCRREGKRKTTVQIDKPIHETSGIQFVNVLAYRSFPSLDLARVCFRDWLASR